MREIQSTTGTRQDQAQGLPWIILLAWLQRDRPSESQKMSGVDLQNELTQVDRDDENATREFSDRVLQEKRVADQIGVLIAQPCKKMEEL